MKTQHTQYSVSCQTRIGKQEEIIAMIFIIEIIDSMSVLVLK